MNIYTKASTVPLKMQYKICYSYVREIAALGEHFHYDEHCVNRRINGILKSRYEALKWHCELHFAPMLIQACEAHYLQSQHDFDKYHDGIWLDKYRNHDSSAATFTRNNRISRYQHKLYGRYRYDVMDDIPF